MNDNHEHRVLRIESLESRSLLAGNLFAGAEFTRELFGDDYEPARDGRDRDSHRSQEVRVDRSSPERSAFDRSKQSRSNDDRAVTSRVESRLELVQEVQTPTQVIVFVPTVRDTVAVNQSANVGSSGLVASVAPADNSAVDVALVSLWDSSAVDAIDADEESSNAIEQADPRMLGEVSTDSPVASFADPADPDVSLERPWFAEIGMGGIERAIDDGLIELSPFELDLALQDLSGQGRESWQVDAITVPRIRSMIERAAFLEIESADLMMQSWDARPGGLIAIDRVLLPQATYSPINGLLDVRLESTLMLHRSLELMASGDGQPVSDVVLDAIMASLNEVAESETQPVTSVKSTRITAIAFPAIAVLTGVAMAVRRKHKDKHPATFTEVKRHRSVT
ncbi:hypothetical protein Pla22_13190 [Rubripirellula amarantea]|uniref:Uncharacterized protein n=1 Tax=Rubripirellula amarantea TaxID=2527999 RepID=A0A5C5WT39_9BACT|nr:hypothetical protein [Rubripirellula amarantea]TWT53688.1 hypothetical protein Pla22_13190 [Rubripirellula amarantea]